MFLNIFFFRNALRKPLRTECLEEARMWYCKFVIFVLATSENETIDSDQKAAESNNHEITQK
jgi:hypothetical protein